jgi:hypothetical protein
MVSGFGAPPVTGMTKTTILTFRHFAQYGALSDGSAEIS